MLKKLFLIGILCLIGLQVASPCSAETTTVYKNTNGHFSFQVPNGWVEIPSSVIKEVTQVLQSKANRPLDLTYEAAFQKQSDRYFSYPYLMVQVFNQKITAGEFEKEFRAGLNNEGLKENQQNLSAFIKSAELDQTTYDKDKHTILMKVNSNAAGRDIVDTSAMILGNQGVIAIHFYSLKQEASQDLSYFEEIMKSFAFDQGFEYQESVQEILEQSTSLNKLPIPSKYTSVLTMAILGAIMGVAVYGLKKLIWRNNVPSIVVKLRWPIGIVVALAVAFAEISANFDTQKSSIVNAFLAYIIAQELKNDEQVVTDVNADQMDSPDKM